MMFRTPVKFAALKDKLNHQTPVLTIGSCFADVIGKKLQENKFNILANPFGVIYNPVSIAALMELVMKGTKPAADTYLQNQDIHYNYLVHGELSALHRDTLENRISELFMQVYHHWQQTSWLMITLGTSFVYERKDNGEVVANCHKMPSNQFSRRMLPMEEVYQPLDGMLQNIRKANREVKVIFTVSPVRHLRDGLPENAVSKSVLRIVCDQLTRKYDQVYYFPSYEILLDELRDYRFYARNMTHPGEVAEEYIWEQFQHFCFDPGTIQLVADWQKMLSAIRHKPYHPGAPAHRQFLNQTIEKLEQFSDRLDVHQEIKMLKERLI